MRSRAAASLPGARGGPGARATWTSPRAARAACAMQRFLDGADPAHSPAPPPSRSARPSCRRPTCSLSSRRKLGLVPDDEASRRGRADPAHDRRRRHGGARCRTSPDRVEPLLRGDQKSAAKRRAQSFVDQRMPKANSRLLESVSRYQPPEPRTPGFAGRPDLCRPRSAFQLVVGCATRSHAMAARAPVSSWSRTDDCVARVRASPAPLASERRIPFNESGIFRHYPELRRTGSEGARRRAADARHARSTSSQIQH